MVCRVLFHVEVSSGMRRARSFNLTAEELQRTVVRPWLDEQPLKLGDREWERRKSALRILEGPELDPPALSFGQGWANAERSSDEVTERELREASEDLAPPPTTVLVEAASATEALEEMIAGREAQAIEWKRAKERIDGRDPSIAAVVLIRQRPEPESPQTGS
jgi:hypothetical protein